MRLVHCGDLHLTKGPRFADALACLHFIVEDGTKAGAELWLIGGDLTGTTVPHESAMEERNALDAVFQAMAATAPVVILCGNHDKAADLVGYGRLRGGHPILVVNPDIYAVPGVEILRVGGAQLCVLPYPFKTAFPHLAGATIAEQNHAAADYLRAVLQHYKEALTGEGPVVLLAHLTIAGSLVGGDEVLAGQEIELTRADLDAFPADYIALSHIHVCQQVTQRAWYAGSPSAQDFGATDTKGYLIVDVATGEAPVVHRRFTPARQLRTLDVTWNGTGWSGCDLSPMLRAQLAGAEVRIRVDMSEEHATTCPIGELESQIQEWGPVAIKVERRILPTIRVRSAAITTARTTDDKLGAWFESLGTTAPNPAQQERCRAKLRELEQDYGAAVVEREVVVARPVVARGALECIA